MIQPTRSPYHRYSAALQCAPSRLCAPQVSYIVWILFQPYLIKLLGWEFLKDHHGIAPRSFEARCHMLMFALARWAGEGGCAVCMGRYCRPVHGARVRVAFG